MKNNFFIHRREGNVLIMSMVILLFFSIVVLQLISFMQKNTRDNVSFSNKNKALMLAREAVTQGLWEINQNLSTRWKVEHGQPVPPYDGTFNNFQDWVRMGFTQFGTDSSDGTFSICITSGPAPHQITIIGQGVTMNGKGTAQITAVYKDKSINAAVYVESDPSVPQNDWNTAYTYVSSGTVSPHSDVQWGPVKTLRGMNVMDSPDFFPRKFAKDRLLGRDNGSANYNSDLTEYWANDPNIELPPEFDFGAMRSSAQTGGYLSTDLSTTTNSTVEQTADTTSYFDGNLTISSSTFFQGVVVVRGNLEITNLAGNRNSAPVLVSVPPSAPTEYAKYAAAHGGAYPPNSYIPNTGTLPNYTFPAGSLGMRAFVYVGGNLTVDAGVNYTVYGSIYVKGKMIVNPASNFHVYYADYLNDASLQQPQFARRTWETISWKEK